MQATRTSGALIIMTLVLRGNNIGESRADPYWYVGLLVAKLTFLTMLDLSDNKIGHAAKTLALALHFNITLKFLYLESNSLDETATALGEALLN
jgi:hypothetical protein